MADSEVTSSSSPAPPSNAIPAPATVPLAAATAPAAASSHPPAYVAVDGGYASVGGSGFPTTSAAAVTSSSVVPPTSPAVPSSPNATTTTTTTTAASTSTTSVAASPSQQPATPVGDAGSPASSSAARVVGEGGATPAAAVGGGNASLNGVVPGGGGGGGTGKKRSSSAAQGKPQSAWMLFIQDRREQVKLDNPDIAVTQQQKIMSEIWKTMSADEREAYRSRARDDQKRYKAEQADKPAVKKEDFYGSSEGGQSTELVCPIGRIGRIIKLDQDVQSVTKEATALIGKAMELFTALVAKESFSVSQSQNRRLLKLQDITDIMHNQDQFYWIKDDFPLPSR